MEKENLNLYLIHHEAFQHPFSVRNKNHMITMEVEDDLKSEKGDRLPDVKGDRLLDMNLTTKSQKQITK